MTPPGRMLLVCVAALAAAIFILASACGDGGEKERSTSTVQPTANGPSGVSSSSVAPNTFLTYEGRRYRLVDLEQANLVDEGEFEQIGVASDADIDQAVLAVYSRIGDDEALYTYAPEQPEPTEVAAVEGEDATTPALWYRWVPEP